MAYQARHRDPLFDSDTQAIIERRGKELLGMVLLGVAILMALMLGSYSPDDPNWLSATDSPARNLLGRLAPLWRRRSMLSRATALGRLPPFWRSGACDSSFTSARNARLAA
ncbi:MAG: DNA translocase FtsK 4TM domain-containing protein [Silicimonas sp.]|nr:DNA translocase FtsK 4TM domain-containing protein [Silicimonas sp.]